MTRNFHRDHRIACGTIARTRMTLSFETDLFAVFNACRNRNIQRLARWQRHARAGAMHSIAK